MTRAGPAGGPGSPARFDNIGAEKLAPVSAALLSAAREEAAAVLRRASDEGRALRERAEAEAEAVVGAARDQAERAAARELAAARGSAHRQAHELVMAGRARAYGELLSRCRSEADALAQRPDYQDVIAGLSSVARRLLGGSAEIVVDGAGQRGVLAVSGSREVDLRLTTLVDRAVAGLGGAIEELWR